jgi:uncharacterized lipoprotein YmbA
VRVVVLLIALSVLASCAPYKQDETADTNYYDSRTTTGSNIPKKGGTGAVVVDKSVVADQINRQGGTLQR